MYPLLETAEGKNKKANYKKKINLVIEITRALKKES